MKIRIEDHVKLDTARMAKIGLATTERAQLDLYCVAPGQSQKPHTHGDQDKIYYVLEGKGRFTVGAETQTLEAGDATVLEVVDAQTTLIQARNAYDDGLVRYRVALAALQTLTGTLQP